MNVRRLTTPLQSAGALVVAFAIAACGGGGGNSSSGSPRVIPTTIPTSSPTTAPSSAPTAVAAAAFSCPTSATNGVAHEVGEGSSTEAATRHAARSQRVAAVAAAGSATTFVAVRYARSAAATLSAHTSAHESAAGASFVQQFDFAHAGAFIRVVAVPSKNAAVAESALRAQAGVVSVAETGRRRFATRVTTPYFTNDPYFAGFSGAPASSLYETASIPGQWDMHAIGLEDAFGYSQSGNGSGIVNANALGTNSVNVAIVDTGEDQTHPELASKISRARCFITDPDTSTQSTSNFTTDEDGHGTDVSGIAAAASNNGFGFTGAGGGVSLMAYRVFPTPDDNCADSTTSDAQCNTDTLDIASAINDAVASGANVISMSLGGDSCVTPSSAYPGGDNDPVEGTAVENAVNAGVVVVAASGNNAPSSTSLTAPACDTGVIAAGASAIDDGQPNGSTVNGSYTAVGSPTALKEYVAYYSQYGTPAADFGDPNAWGIVAPGADPTGSSDADNLHWIANIWTSTPFTASSSDTSFLGVCSDDYPNGLSTTGTVDCRTLIAGTSMSTPHVAGAAALILAATGGSASAFHTSAAMKQLLCKTADDIGSTQHEGCGRLNVYRAMATALGDTSPP